MDDLYGFNELEPGHRFEKEHRGGVLGFTRLTSASEIGPYLELLNELWGFSDREMIPLHEAVVVVKTGGLFLGVRLDGKPAGLVYVMPAFTREWGYHHHSNFMGYKPEYRSMGLGLEAKRVHAILAARDKVELVTWTFDPLQAMNANLNFRKLGCICRNYVPDLYGSMGGHFDPGLPTDRFLVEWRLESDSVKAGLEGRIPTPEEVADRFASAPVLEIGDRLQDTFVVPVPDHIHELARQDLETARAELMKFQRLFQDLFQSGYMVTGLVPAGARDGHNYYVVEKGD